MNNTINPKQEPCCADVVFMVEPVAFGFNAETAVNNYFQNSDETDGKETQKQALAEFSNLVSLLREAGVKVINIKDTEFPHTPDSIFPNNWVSFHLNNQVVLYPMFAENRRLERRMDILSEIENELGRKFQYTDYSQFENDNIILEGTGSIVLDRTNRMAYAVISPRTDKNLFIKFCEEQNYRPVIFNSTQNVNGEFLPIYHTNVVMCVTHKFVIICLDTIRDAAERAYVVQEIENSGKEVFEISVEQMNNFAGNMLQLRNDKGEELLAMSQAAYDSLTPDQVNELEKHFKLIVAAIPTIEKFGGGSVRCMIAEVI